MAATMMLSAFLAVALGDAQDDWLIRSTSAMKVMDKMHCLIDDLCGASVAVALHACTRW